MKNQKQLNKECQCVSARFWAFAIYSIYAIVMLYCLMAMYSARAESIEQLVTRAAKSEGVNADLALAIATVESNLNPSAVGSLGEIGLFQLRPEYHSVKKGNPEHNVFVAVRYLAQLKRQCAAYGDAFFVCYNYGPARKLKHPKQFPYYVKVMKALERNKRESAQRLIANAD